MTDQIKTETIRKPLMSGHCASHAGKDSLSKQEFAAHDRCQRNGGGQRANPKREFQPCPCAFHYGEIFECGGCGREIAEALLWPFDEDGDMRYTHIDGSGRALGEDCAAGGKAPVVEEDDEAVEEEEVSGNPEEDIPDEIPDEDETDDLNADYEPEDEAEDDSDLEALIIDDPEDDDFTDLEALLAEDD